MAKTAVLYKSWDIQQVQQVINSYDAEHDLGPDAPVTWREERLARAVMEISNEVDVLKKQVKALLDAVPSARVDR